MTAPRPWDPESFEARYRTDADPWDFRTSTYERERFGAITRALGSRCRHVLEPGCANGELTAELAAVSGRVTAFDVAPTAVRLARRRCSSSAHVDILCEGVEHVALGHLSDVDGVVFSEIGYYFTPPALARIVRRLVGACQRPATFVACHWLGESADHQLHGDEVHRVLAEVLEVSSELRVRHPDHLLERWRLR